MGFDVDRPVPFATDLKRFWHIWDDFTSISFTNNYPGELQWRADTIAGAGGAFSNVDPSAQTEVGLYQLTTDGANGDGVGSASRGGVVFGFPVGSTLEVRVKLDQVADTAIWIGLASGITTDERVAAANHFIGWRLDTATDGNLYAVTKNGAAAGNETTLSLGAADTDYHRLTMAHFEAGTILCLLDGVVVGTMSDSDVSTTARRPKIGIVAGAVAAQDVTVDFWQMYGEQAR